MDYNNIMDLSFIPNMNTDVENIIFQFKKDLEAFDIHKKRMKNVFEEMKSKITCIKCKTHIKQYHIYNINDPKQYIQSPLCFCCFFGLTWISVIDFQELYEMSD